MLDTLLTVGPEWLYHPLGQCAGTHAEIIRCKSYNFHSGIFGNWAIVTTLLAGLAGFWVKHNCHEHRCLRLSWHPDAEGHPVCKRHHEDHPSKGWFRTDANHPRHARNN